MKAMIFAAGLGTRLKPITDSIPKALVSVGDRPLLDRQIEALKMYGFKDIVVNVHHFAHLIKKYLVEHNNFGVNISISDETDLLRETGGGIKHAAKLLNDGEPFLVMNVDVLTNVNLERFYEYHISQAISNDTPLATLLVSDRKTSRYLLFDKDDNLVGWMNEQSGEVKSPFADINTVADCSGFKKYAFAGMHVMSPYIFDLMHGLPDKFSIIDFYLGICDKYNIRGYVKKDLRFLDVGKVDSLAEAEKFFNRTCPECGEKFLCNHNDIALCHCVLIHLTPEQLDYIKKNYNSCLCHKCLEAVSKMNIK